MTDARTDDPTKSLSTADALAEAGNWPAAIEAWQRVASEHPSLQPAVERRLEWFLMETGPPRDGLPRTFTMALAFLVSTVLGTVFLAFAGTPGSLGADLWAGAAWVMILTASASALIGARRSGDASLGDRVATARRVAERLDREPAQGEAT